MRLLLDTHALLWWLAGDENLSSEARRAVGDETTTVIVSAVCAYEIALKHRLGKLPDASLVVQTFEATLERQGFDSLPISIPHALRAGRLPLTHRDPFDRLLIAQALIDDLTLVSNERRFDDFGVKRLW
ncbi:type II toxin-antitoxin system VapC family toxin [Brevundimonas sp. TWP2-3-2]|uniref:type II toxin-antitoxin system VapC family toxin n=1 Tax=unclassified Brevundimonas TaxID=2622653 RepID=UPI003CF11CD9